MPDWLPNAITWLVSTFIGAGAAYAAIQKKLANIDSRLETAESEIEKLRKRSHDQQDALLRLDGRVGILSDRDER